MQKTSSIPKNANAILMFSSGQILYGKGIGFKNKVFGEICFNTSMTGYQEILTDPSYKGQIINFTFPHIGNIGANSEDIESNQRFANGFIVREEVTKASNYRSDEDFENWLIKNKITGISGIDTRAVTQYIRENGPENVAICYVDDVCTIDINQLKSELISQAKLDGLDLAKDVTTDDMYPWNQTLWKDDPNDQKFKVVAIDYGVKQNILRYLYSKGCEVIVVPADSSFEDIKKYNPDGVFLSNGPGDPFATGSYAIQTIKDVIENNIPLFGICLGHQLVALAVGAKTEKMHQGHRGANHPVKNLQTGKVEITSQNHGFMVVESSLPKNAIVTHKSLFDNSLEGFKLSDKPVFCVQYHPESSPGPHDSSYLFEDFIELMKKNKSK